MKHVDRNLQPQLPVAEGGTYTLPAARIRCDSGWICVGEKVYHSASDALTAYLQQFDGKQAAAAVSTSGSGGTSLGTVIQSSMHPFSTLPHSLNGTSALFNSPLQAALVSKNFSSGSSMQGAVAGSLSSSLGPGINVRSAQGLSGQLFSSTHEQNVVGVTTVSSHLTNSTYNNTDVSGHTALPAVSQVLGTGDRHRTGPRSAVETLLCSQPLQKSLDAEVTDTQQQARLKQHAQEVHPRTVNIPKSPLQKEVEEALSRSAQLLETIKGNSSISSPCASNVESTSTDVLLSINPQRPSDALTAITSRQGRNQHRYSYYTPNHHRSSSLSRIPSSINLRSLRESGRRRSLESLGLSFLTNTSADKIYHGGSNSSRLSHMSDPSDILQNSLYHQHLAVTDRQNKKQLLLRQNEGPPHWIRELVPSSFMVPGDVVIGDSMFTGSRTHNGHPTPSWVNGLASSDITYCSTDMPDVQSTRESQELLGMKNVTEDPPSKSDKPSVVDLSYAAPGLNYSDLGTSQMAKKHRVSFNTYHLPSHTKKLTANMSDKLAEHNVNHGNESLSLSVDSASQECKKLPGQSVEKYLSHLNLNTNAVRDTAGKTNKRAFSLVRCSSVDKLHLENLPSAEPSDIIGASPITRTSNLSNGRFVDDTTFAASMEPRSTGSDQALKTSPASDDLDGDRPWEIITSAFKPPVYIDNHNLTNQSPARPGTPTLSGGHQPGSMEALKKMLFRLQTEETSSSDAVFKLSSPFAGVDGATLIPALKDYNFDEEPGGQSLERALVHLGRLKTLVQSASVATQRDWENGVETKYSQEETLQQQQLQTT